MQRLRHHRRDILLPLQVVPQPVRVQLVHDGRTNERARPRRPDSVKALATRTAKRKGARYRRDNKRRRNFRPFPAPLIAFLGEPSEKKVGGMTKYPAAIYLHVAEIYFMHSSRQQRNEICSSHPKLAYKNHKANGKWCWGNLLT